jgi:hypothetical protein
MASHLALLFVGTLATARATHLTFFSVVGSILVLAALWLIVGVLTVNAALLGDIFVVPRVRAPYRSRRMERTDGFSLEQTRWEAVSVPLQVQQAVCLAIQWRICRSRDVRFARECVAKVESCRATNFSRKYETESDHRFV